MNEFIKSILARRMLVTIFLGFSSGLPLLSTMGTLQAWMVDSNVDLTLIGIFSLVGLPYTVKFLWAPIIDRYTPPFLGRRRGWMVITQIMVMLSLVGLGLCDPQKSPLMVAVFALFVTFSSASQDVVLDAHRRDTLKENELGLGSALFINGYRIGMLVSGAMALWLADQIEWRYVYFFLAGCMSVGLVTTIFSPEPEKAAGSPTNMREAVVLPFIDYFKRKDALIILAFILLYKLGDSMASAMTTPYIIQELGFTKTELAAIAKTFGLVSTIIGGLIGGLILLKVGINRSLWVFGFFQAISTATFSLLMLTGNDRTALAAVIAFENVSSGMGTAAYAAFMASLCDKRFSATQYALLSSLMGVPRVVASAPTGYLVKTYSWEVFFLACAFIAIPGMLLLFKVAPWNAKRD